MGRYTPQRLLRPAGLFLAVLLLLAPRLASAQDTSGAQAFISDLGGRAISVLQEDPDPSATSGPFRQLFQEGFDIPTIGQFALGPYWRQATEEQKRAYLDAFENLIVRTYARRFSEYSGETLQVSGARAISDTDILVNSQIVRPSGPPVAVGWRVRDRGGSFQVIDVLVEGISMGGTQRDEFTSVVQRNGGNINALIDAMRRQVGG